MFFAQDLCFAQHLLLVESTHSEMSGFFGKKYNKGVGRSFANRGGRGKSGRRAAKTVVDPHGDALRQNKKSMRFLMTGSS